jgi:hypothetical protein
VISFTSRLLYPQDKDPRYQLDEKLGNSENQFGPLKDKTIPVIVRGGHRFREVEALTFYTSGFQPGLRESQGTRKRLMGFAELKIKHYSTIKIHLISFICRLLTLLTTACVV